MKYKSIFILVKFFNTIMLSQSHHCKTDGMVNPYFSTSKSAINYSNRTSLDILPIALHLFTDSSGGGNDVSPAIFSQALDSINVFLSTVNLKAKVCILNIVKDNNNVNAPIDLDGFIMDSVFVTGYVNVYIPNTVNGDHSSGYSTIIGGHFTDNDNLLIMGKGFTYGLLAHELGHFFGLYHTFESRFGLELVNGSNCSVAGDLLCDTDADPGIQRTQVDSVTCSWLYPGTLFDPIYQPYNPSTTNYMSYTQLHCAIDFTPMQLQVIRNIYDTNINYLVNNCSISSIEMLSLNNNLFNLFPNPNSGLVKIEFNKLITPELDGKLSVYGVSGEKIYTKRILFSQNTTQIDLSFLKRGVYLFKIESENHLGFKKLVLQN